MSDLIDRQAAIAAVSIGALSAATVYGRTDAGATALRETIKVINALPAAQQWIPVTERLPDTNGRYLVTNTHWGAYEVDLNIFFNNQGWLREKGVVAWMPLPEPYES